MPLQHISDRMLKRMNRKHSRGETETIIGKLRDKIPGLVLRTTFIVGFPGETDADFTELLDYVGTAKFERLGVFPYSFESDTPAAKLADHLPQEIKLERRDLVMATQQPIAFAANQLLVGRDLDVLIDGPSDRGPGEMIGRTYADAPDVDGVVYVKCRDLEPGDLVSCRIVATEGYDLSARPGTKPASRRRSRPKPRKKPSNPLTILN